MGSRIVARFVARCGEPIAPASLAFFRIAFGALLMWEIVRFLSSDWIDEHYVRPLFHFRYFGFEWVAPLPQPWLTRLFGALLVCAAAITLGFATRLFALLFFAGFGYVFLLEQARYLNHLYLALLLVLLLAWLPTDGCWSWRAWQRGARPAPRGALGLLRAQLAIVYVYAAIAKLNGDWLQGEPLRQWMRERAELPWIGPLLAHAWAPWVMSYGGLLLDLLVVPLLLVRRTRPWMFAAVCSFHLLNHVLFDIGIFPWMAIGATTLFFEPDWPERLLARMRRRPTTAVVEPRVAAQVAKQGAAQLAASPQPCRAFKFACVVGVAWLAVQLLVPLRHLLYPGPVSWTEEGHRFAWHMKLRSKTSSAHFVVTDPRTGERRLVDPRHELTSWQLSKMGDRPDMVLQYAHHLADRFAAVDAATGARLRPQVRAIVDCSLNGRDPQELIDSEADLAQIERTLGHATWIVPLREELPPQWRRGRVDFDE